MRTSEFMEKGKMIAIDVARDTGIRVRSGSVWMTQEDGRDYVLIAGQELALKEDARALVTAIQPSLLDLYRIDPVGVRTRLEREARRAQANLVWKFLGAFFRRN